MIQLPVSIVVVSHGRPEMLKRCLLGLSQLQYDPFEVILVADPLGIAAAGQTGFADDLKIIPFEEPNISAARNLGVAAAAGELIAFIDDDAVPEPQWLRYLCAPAVQSDVAAMGGYVRARNGISFQWRAQRLDPMGLAHSVDHSGSDALVLRPGAGEAVKTEGTNMAIRRDVLIKLGGFDEAFHFFLDETDLNMRLARDGHATALVPLAEVHHGYAASRFRTAARVPRDLFDIGASWAVFQRKHLPKVAHSDHWKRLRLNEKQRLLRHLVQGTLEPRDVRRLMQRLDLGYVTGQDRPVREVRLSRHPAHPFKAFPSRPRTSVLLHTGVFGRRARAQEAAERVKNGEIVTLLSLSRSAIFHQLKFNDLGIWMQYGGIYGKSDRNQPLFAMTTRSRRVENERMRVARQRGFGHE